MKRGKMVLIYALSFLTSAIPTLVEKG